MNCQQVDELLAAYALDAVDDDERLALEAHLEGCDLHVEASEFSAAAAGLALLVEEREPSADLEARILSAVGPRALPGAVAGGGPSPRRLDRGLLRWPAAVAAAVLLFAVGFAAGGVLLSGDDEAPASVLQMVREGDTWIRAEGSPEARTVNVEMGGFDPRTGDERYQVWAVREGRWLSVGVCNTNEDGWWGGDFEFTLQPGDALAVTIEPAGGSPRPTGASILGVPR